jgi:hypothetical protein
MAGCSGMDVPFSDGQITKIAFSGNSYHARRIERKLAAWDRSDFSAVTQFRHLGVRGKTIPNFQGQKIREAA